METTVYYLLPEMFEMFKKCREGNNNDVSEEDGVDYPDAESFEAALNRLEADFGNTVRFKIKDIGYFSEDRYNLHASERLYFVVPKDREYKVGDEVTVEFQYLDLLPDDFSFSKITWIINDDRQEIKRYVDECVKKLLDEDSPEES